MYSVTYGERLIYRSGNGALPAYDLHLSETENGAPEFSFQIPAGHPFNGKLEAGRNEVVIFDSRDGTYSEDHEIFRGKITGIETDFQNGQRIECAGAFSYLEHSIQRPSEHQNEPVSQFVAFLLGEHNKQVSPEERIYPGTVTVQGSLGGCTDYETTLECMEGKLLKEFGGRLVLRRQGGKNYLDYLDGYRNTGNQPVEFGRNLLDFSQNMDASEIYTVCIPLGAKLEESSIEGLDAYLTVESVNNGNDYVENPEAAALYGRRAKAVSWKEVTSPEELKKKGEEWLASNQYEMLSLEVSAIDLSMAGEEFESFKLGDETLVRSRPHGLDRRFPITKRDRYLDAPEKNTITLGKSVVKGIVGSVRSGREEVKEELAKLPSDSQIVSLARKSATELITAAMNGYVATSPDEILIMDAPEKEDAKKVWRWNLGGLGYSKTGYQGPYETAMTMDGEIVADFIRAGSLSADRIKSGTLSADRIGGGTIEGDVVAKNFTMTGGKIAVAASDSDHSVISLSSPGPYEERYEASICPGYIKLREYPKEYDPDDPVNIGHSMTIDPLGIEYHTSRGDSVYFGYREFEKMELKINEPPVRFGSKLLDADGTSTSIPVLTQAELNGMFGGTGFSGGNTMVSFANGDGQTQSVHVEGAVFMNGAWYATFSGAPAAGPIRINYMVSYFG